MNSAAWRHYSGFYRGSYQSLLAAIVLSVIQALFVLPMTWLIRYAFDRVLPSGDFQMLLSVALALVVLSVAGIGLTLWTRSRILKITKSAVSNFRRELLDRCYELPRSFYDLRDSDDLHTAIVQDTERVDVMSNALIAQLLPAAVTAFGLCFVLLFINPLLFAMLLVVVPLLALMNRRLSRRAKSSVREYHRSFERFSSGVAFVLQMMDLTRAQSAERFELERQQSHIDELRITSARTAWLDAAYGMMHGVVSTVSGALILVIGGLAVSAGRMSLGQLLAFFVAVGLLSSALSRAVALLPSIIAGNESLTTLFNFLRTGDALPYSGRRTIDFRGEITLESVSFGYDARPLLQNVNLNIGAGKTVSIVGANGSGKTTLAYLVLGFYRPQTGRLCADRIPFDDLDLVALRRSIGVVMQDASLFSGTIRENITYGSPEATEADIVRAARLATASDFISNLPDALETRVGATGGLLSGGERQRVAIARAVLSRSRLLILDEPTNHLDSDAVEQLIDNLSSLDDPPAILLITHDPEVAKLADDTYRLCDGSLTAL